VALSSCPTSEPKSSISCLRCQWISCSSLIHTIV
jgi:hypothetical protein